MKKVFKYFGVGGHDCREIISKVETLVDGELDEESQARLITEINKCPACLEHYNLDKAFKDFVQKKIERKPCAETVKNQILERIREIES